LNKSLIGFVASACLPLVSIAQPPVGDPASPVPAVVYRSAFAGMPRGVETEALPWKEANAAVGQFTRGHMDILKWEAAQQKSDPGRAATPAPLSMPMPHGAGMVQEKP